MFRWVSLTGQHLNVEQLRKSEERGQVQGPGDSLSSRAHTSPCTRTRVQASSYQPEHHSVGKQALENHCIFVFLSISPPLSIKKKEVKTKVQEQKNPSKESPGCRGSGVNMETDRAGECPTQTQTRSPRPARRGCHAVVSGERRGAEEALPAHGDLLRSRPRCPVSQKACCKMSADNVLQTNLQGANKPQDCMGEL